MTYEDLPKDARAVAARTRSRLVREMASSPAEFKHWARLLHSDAILLEAVRNRLAEWARGGGGKAETIIGQTVGSMIAYGVETERAMMAVQFVLHATQGPANP